MCHLSVLHRYYYLSPCAGSTHQDMPFNLIAKHTSSHGSVTGVEYLTLELFDSTQPDEASHLLFFSASFTAFVDSAVADGTLYEDNAANAVNLEQGTTRIGDDFLLTYSKSHDNRIEATLSTSDGCSVSFWMYGQKMKKGIPAALHPTPRPTPAPTTLQPTAQPTGKPTSKPTGKPTELEVNCDDQDTCECGQSGGMCTLSCSSKERSVHCVRCCCKHSWNVQLQED